jgi:hypothetical protein
MHRLASRITMALVTLTLLDLTGSVDAQQASKNQVPIKFPFVTVAQAVLIPLNPPILSAHLTGTGEAPLLGQYTFVGHQFVRLGPNGEPVACTDGVGALTGANGDALFINYSGLHHPTASPDVIGDNFTFTINGGTGRFAGASGSGRLTGEVKIGGAGPGKDLQSLILDGTVSTPRQP